MAETTATRTAVPFALTSLGSSLRDIVSLGKPSITLMSAIVAAGAMLLAPGRIAPADALWSLIGIACAVSGAGALNMLLERDVDALMARTAKRPLPAGRLHPLWAAAVGL
ncbi:MAG TPA: UbiA family prenyltransferase, partial [Myxococcota bacterium]